MRAGGLFTGIEGFGLALHRAGIDNVWSVEIDERCRILSRGHFPDTTYYADVQDVRGEEMLSEHGAVDLLHGGFPCQDISVAGRRAGLAGARSGLWWEYHRILSEIRPQWCIIENVAGLLSSNGGRDLGAILGALGDLGYGFAYRVLDAQGFGVPQRRRRVFIVGRLGDGRGPAEVLLEPESGGGDLAPSGAPRPASAVDARRGAAGLLTETGVVSALSSRMGTSGHGDLANAQAGWLIPALTTRCGNTQDDQQTSQLVPFRKMRRAGVDDPSPESWEQAQVANTLDATGNSTRTSHAIAFHVTQTPISDTVAPAMGTGNSQGCATIGVATELGVRRLTPLECERLQGFPDNWTAGQPDSHRYKQLGNAVAVPVVEWIARRLVNVHHGREANHA